MTCSCRSIRRRRKSCSGEGGSTRPRCRPRMLGSCASCDAATSFTRVRSDFQAHGPVDLAPGQGRLGGHRRRVAIRGENDLSGILFSLDNLIYFAAISFSHQTSAKLRRDISLSQDAVRHVYRAAVRLHAGARWRPPLNARARARPCPWWSRPRTRSTRWASSATLENVRYLNF